MSDPTSPPTPRPNRSVKLAERMAQPFVRFMELEVSSAILLLVGSVVALIWANSPWGASYAHFWHTPLSLQLGDLIGLELSLAHWVNDGLMAVFFFVDGMEIKRELVEGELSSRSRALLPILAALGGMVVPAGIYAYFHAGGVAAHGWGIPMATDIAFAVAALSVLGPRVPPSLRIFLLALAIVDDLGAIAVIAVFYTAEIHLSSLGLAAGGMVFCVLMNKAGIRSFLPYLVVGCFVWFETHHSGVHATIAGVLLGFLTPCSVDEDDHESLIERSRHALERMREVLVGVHETPDPVDHGGHARHHAGRQLSDLARNSISPLDYLVNVLERPVAFVIMPIFALANAGVVLDTSTLGEPMALSVAWAVALGLVVGKPIGVTLFSWLAVRSGLAELPRGVNWGMVAATGVLAGIGFTVALFVTALAFDDSTHIAGSKIGILAGSVVATAAGLVLLARSLPKPGTK
ncbi:MAG: Na+/H+ antiporter NhaA [bacterium]|nr:Na+/H+ antiporter NhaA [bacterium]